MHKFRNTVAKARLWQISRSNIKMKMVWHQNPSPDSYNCFPPFKIPNTNTSPDNIFSVINIFHRITKIQQLNKTFTIFVVQEYSLLTIAPTINMIILSFHKRNLSSRHTKNYTAYITHWQNLTTACTPMSDIGGIIFYFFDEKNLYVIFLTRQAQKTKGGKVRIVIYNYPMSFISISSMQLLLRKKVTRPDPEQRILEIENGEEEDLIAILQNRNFIYGPDKRPDYMIGPSKKPQDTQRASWGFSFFLNYSSCLGFISGNIWSSRRGLSTSIANILSPKPNPQVGGMPCSSISTNS
jgi:hypothetical protein